MGNVPRGPGRSGPRLGSPWGTSHDEIYVLGEGFAGKPRLGSVLRYVPDIGSTWRHPTKKPVALMRQLIHYCPPPERSFYPFMGSRFDPCGREVPRRHAIGIED